MSLYSTNILLPSAQIPNGITAQMSDKPKNRAIYLDVTPPRTSYAKSANRILPMTNNLMESTISKDVIYENIKPVFIILRVMGVLPLTKPSPCVNRFYLMSPSMAYSAIVYCSLVGYVMYLSLNKVQILRTAEGKFEEAVIEYLFTVYLFPMMVIPIMWYETRKIGGVLNSWVDFESERLNSAEVDTLQRHLVGSYNNEYMYMPILTVIG